MSTSELNIRKDFLPLSKPTLKKEEINEVLSSLKSGWITTGPKVIEFEKRLKEYTGAKHCIVLNSGTAGLHISLMALGIKEGDEVITTPMTFAATVNVIELVGAKPIFVDINPDTMNILENEIEKKITKRTKAIIPVHFAGQPCDMNKIRQISRKHKIPVIEDAAHAIGTEYKGKKIGTLSALTVFSFHPLKNITTGEGGLITTDNASLADKLKLLRFHGINTSAWDRYSRKGKAQYQLITPGFKYNMLDIEAGIGIHQIGRLNSFIEKRKRLAKLYDSELKDCEGIFLPGKVDYDCRHAWHLYIIKINTKILKINRDEFIEELKKYNIGTGIHFPAIHVQPYYRKKYGYKKDDYRHAAFVSERIISLPLFPLMKDSDVKYVTGVIKTIIRTNKK